jgi:hypothetical protein
MKGGVATTLTVTIAAGGAFGVYSNTANKVSFASGDTVRVNLQNNDGSNATGAIGSVVFEMENAY